MKKIVKGYFLSGIVLLLNICVAHASNYNTKVLQLEQGYRGGINIQSQDNWFELYEVENQFYIKPAVYKIQLYQDDCTGEKTARIKTSERSLLLINLPLTEGLVKSVAIGEKVFFPYKGKSFKFLGKIYRLESEAKVDKTIDMHDLIHGSWDKVKDYKLYLTAHDKKKRLLFSQHMYKDTATQISFVGDIDGDEEPDFILRSPRDYEEVRYVLFLSSQNYQHDPSFESVVQFDC